MAPLGLEVGQTIHVRLRPPSPLPGNAMTLADVPIGLAWCTTSSSRQVAADSCVARPAPTLNFKAREGKYAVVSAALGRIASHPHRMPRDDRARREHRPPERQARKGRPSSRHLGRRPKVRGTAMNPVDHPLGGGEGRTKAVRSSPLFTDRRARQRWPHSSQATTRPTSSFCVVARTVEVVDSHGTRSTKKGPVHRCRSWQKKVEAMRDRGTIRSRTWARATR